MPKSILLTRSIALAGLAAAVLACASLTNQAADQNQPPMTEPKLIDPGPVGGPPADAVILFDGKDLAQWRGRNGEAKWEVKDGVATVNGTGSITSKQEFGDMQLHLEWATPAEVKGEGQGRGNSGVFLMGHYEIQVFDSYNNKTYFHGQ